MNLQQEIAPNETKEFEWASDLQREAVEAPPGAPLLLMGGFNSGKTTAAILRELAFCEAFPGYKVVVLRKSFKDLTLTTRPSFDQWIDRARCTVSNDKEVILDNGSSFIFHYLDDPNSATILKGLEINAAICDQAEQMQERTFRILLGRLGRWKKAAVPQWIIDSHPGPWPWRDQSGKPVPPYDCVLTANPSEDGDPELHWLWQRFSVESTAYKKKWSKLGYRQMVLPTTTNKFATEQNISLLTEGQDEDFIRRFVKGEWVRSKGHLFRLEPESIIDYDPSIVSNVKNTMRLGRVLDFGDSAPTACLFFGIDENHNIIFFMEYYQPGITQDGKEFTVADHRRVITELSKGMTFSINLADPIIFKKTRGISGYNTRAKRWTIADEFMDRKIIQENTTLRWFPADNSEDLSRQRLRQYLRIDPMHKNPFTGEIGAPHIYFIQKSDENPIGIFHAIKEIRNAKRQQKGEVDGKPIFGDERDTSIPDHSLDCVRYVLNAHPLPSTPISERVTEQRAEMVGQQRILITVPEVKRVHNDRLERGGWKQSRSWRSRFGGY